MQLFFRLCRDSYKKNSPSIITFDPLAVCGGVCVCIDPTAVFFCFIILVFCYLECLWALQTLEKELIECL